METMTSDLAEKTIRSIGLILGNSNVYGPAHSVTHNAIDACFRHLSGLWQTTDVTVQHSEGNLTVNSVSVEQRNSVFIAFVEHLTSRSISNFTLKPAMTRAQFAGFIEILLATPDELQQLGAFSGAITAIGLGDVVTSRKVTYVEVNEDEVVVDKDAMRDADGASAAEQRARQVQDASAYLRGDSDGSTADAASSLRDLSTDTDQLSSLIVASAQGNGADGDALAGEIVTCLQRLYQAMTGDPSFHTQKTKKQIHKTLVALETELPAKLQADADRAATDNDSIQAIKDTIETMEDELTIDTLSQEYVKRRSAIGSSEKRILRFMKNKSVDMIEESDLKSRLIEGGLAPEDWQDLLAKSGVIDKPPAAPVPPPPPPGHGQAVFTHLNDLLRKIEADTGKPAAAQEPSASAEAAPATAETDGKRAVMLRVPEAVLAQDLHAVQQEVNRIILTAEKRIEKLVNDVEEEEQQKDRKGSTGISRKRLFEILSEIGQELCQPLAVINCSVDTILSGMLGDINKVQREMLDLSADSAQKMKVLIDRVVDIAGVPDDLVVNKQIQSSLYQ